MNVSINAYNDAELLAGCLASVRTVLGDVPIQVVDGRYETFPGSSDNSTDATPQVCDAHGATYVPGGPFPREEHKHEFRLEQAPDGERVLFLDADERLLQYEADHLEPDTPYKVRFHNPITYHESRELFYYPRSFNPEWVAGYTRTDMPEFEHDYYRNFKDRGQTDAITITHRHDLRGMDYREAKLVRYENEDRGSPYGDHVSAYFENNTPGEVHPCPECGEESVYKTVETAHGGLPLSRVATCGNGECYAAVEFVELGRYRYLPDSIREGYDEDPERLRLELLDAGVVLLTYYETHDFAPEILEWVLENDARNDEWPAVANLD